MSADYALIIQLQVVNLEHGLIISLIYVLLLAAALSVGNSTMDKISLDSVLLRAPRLLLLIR